MVITRIIMRQITKFLIPVNCHIQGELEIMFVEVWTALNPLAVLLAFGPGTLMGCVWIIDFFKFIT